MSGALVPNLLLFGRVLRGVGLDVHPGRMVDAAAAMADLGVTSRTDVRATLRTLLVHRHDDLAVFDRAFDLFWRAREVSTGGLPLFSLGERPRIVVRRTPGADLGVEIEGVASDAEPASRLAVGAWSSAELSRTRDFAEFTDDEVRRAQAVLGDMGWRLGTRRTRRWIAARRGAIDLRRVARRSLTRGGELVELPRRRRGEKPRPIVALCDVSGSMERYSRLLLHFVAGLARVTSRAESFVFATRLTRVTRAVHGDDAARKLTRLARDAQDWGGGTRIGDALRAFNLRWSRRVMRNGPTVLIVSDGWDRGDPAVIAREMARLRRRCHRLVWLNPLLGAASYEPLTRGMQAALPFVDAFLPVHNLASLEQLAATLGGSLQSRRRASIPS
jgi:uncharacterized protein